ncbi:hypothetical protein [Parafannyhessea umbonata]|uniref:hypothetical protein n=1 Tax=Parafannyhessea umbonata TaxID=604330 RepID=UPI002A82E451|nr:hypothetical protein [Parafannyhessea umbonata]MDY4014828.1 hypothetical protein [Parafannyhessea umbonata]
MTSDTRLERARAAGTRALQSLDEAADQLDSARNWGLLDILGGGILTSLVKRSRLDGASEAVGRAQRDLEAFARELHDCSGVTGMDLRRSDMLELFDIVFDNSITDLFVQSRIEDAREDVRRARARVQAILAELGSAGRA